MRCGFFDSNRFLFMKNKMGGQKEKELGIWNVAVLDRIPFGYQYILNGTLRTIEKNPFYNPFGFLIQ